MSGQSKFSKNYWFPAKKYGWGWGLPVVWQGWIVFILYLCVMVLNIFLLALSQKMANFYFGTIIATLALLIVCWLKGEPPKWRWGK